jgi:hypothetical protein
MLDTKKILQELISREPIFHHPDKFGRTRQDIQNQMSDDFFEIGASGRVYTKQDIIEILLDRYNDPHYHDDWQTSDFNMTTIAPDHYLVTYILTQDKTRITRRSTLWRVENNTWKIVYHQGTIVDSLAP